MTILWFSRMLKRPILYYSWMTRSEKQIFYRYIGHSIHYLEFGIGGSTIGALLKSNAQVTCVESSLEWIGKLRKYRLIRMAEKHKRLKIKHVDLGKIADKGYPVDLSKRKNFPAYSSLIFDEINPLDLDCALVDGRFRVACTLQIILHCHMNSVLYIIIHDIWNRSHYHYILKYLLEIERVDSLGVFQVRKGINFDLVRADYEQFRYDPR